MLCPPRSGTAIPRAHPLQEGRKRQPRWSREGSQNLKTIFNKILREEVSVREGSQVRKVSKAEAVVRGMVLGALKGDQRHLTLLFRLAEQTGQLQETGGSDITKIERVIVSWRGQDD
jgi:uncharacterized protein DUF5681